MRVKHTKTGIVMSVFDASGARLGPEWAVVAAAEETPEATAAEEVPEVAPPKKARK